MNEDFKLAYKRLDKSDKRNELNNEMRFTFGIIKAIRAGLNMEDGVEDIKNYDINKDESLTEEELLEFYYEDIYTIQKEIMDIADHVFNE